MMTTKINFIAVMLALAGVMLSFNGQAQKHPGIIRQTTAHLDSLAKNDHFSGVVLMASHGRTLLEKAYGFANLADRLPNKPDTRFNLASMGKMLTAVAIMQLVEAHKVSLDETVGKYLPDFPNRAIKDSVTIRQLLTHTSGMGNFWEALDKAAFQHYRTLKDYLPLFAASPLRFKPGKSFLYSNDGYMVLGLVIEAVAGTDYFDYVTANVFRPAGMSATGFPALDEVNPNMAAGFTRSTEQPGKWLNNNYTGVIKGLPAGGCYSTAGDLLRFAGALTRGKLLGAAGLHEMTTGKFNYERGKYGLGFVEEQVNGHRIIGHSGGNTGIADELMIVTDLDYTVVILTNGDVDNYWGVDAFIRKQLVGATPQTRNYDFTQRLISAAISKDNTAAAALFHNKPADIVIRAGVIEQAGNKLLWERKAAAAVRVCRLNVLAYPEESYVYLNLAEACRQAGDRTEAIANYKKYLEKEPDDKDAALHLQQLLKL
ncbi:CubicO group peptidase, beta-lactamase class C family [Mucilaginibacter pineti]|uniref:CubicO group peptidase, beta-lactamase class C family n=2 Tax=Mucilaginibacter pineti TaxID=1391627 RepID=A0A1G7IMG4_9SPHI|nr:CubicO group peptidase, beta-lactamase class C family [Mucilaginibacter pineti]